MGKAIRCLIFSFMAAGSFAASCHAGVLDPVGPIGVGDKAILFDSLAIMLAIIVPVIAMIVLFAWWFRASNPKAKRLPEWEYSGQLELVVWSLPLMVVLFLGGIAWIGSHQLDPHYPLASKQKPIQVEVISMDWKWLFIYPEQGVASVNQLALPVGVPVEFSLTSADVMNSFFVPRLGSQIYTMAGMVTHVNLQADQAGSFPGLSAQFSGDGFSDMRFTVLAMPQDQFEAWMAGAKSSDKVLDQTAYDQLSRPSKADPVTLYKGVTPDLFGHIVEISAPGTMTGAMGEDASSAPKSLMHMKD